MPRISLQLISSLSAPQDSVQHFRLDNPTCGWLLHPLGFDLVLVVPFIVVSFIVVVDVVGGIEGFVADGRVGDSHLNVPGPDGKSGFGGSCFPKDINAFMSFAKE